MTAHFITLEGIEGVGKTTALATIKQCLTERHIKHVFSREPGGTAIAEKIRQLLIDHQPDENLNINTELLLFFAGRSQHIEVLIKPTLARGISVVSDRFVDASFAYQGGGRQVPIQHLNYLDDWIVADARPDVTLLLDAPVEIALQRMQQRQQLDRIEVETVDFFQRVRDCYLQRAQQLPQRYHIIDASLSLLEVKQQLISVLAQHLGSV